VQPTREKKNAKGVALGFKTESSHGAMQHQSIPFETRKPTTKKCKIIWAPHLNNPIGLL
jgi:hypothetical protein